MLHRLLPLLTALALACSGTSTEPEPVSPGFTTTPTPGDARYQGDGGHGPAPGSAPPSVTPSAHDAQLWEEIDRCLQGIRDIARVRIEQPDQEVVVYEGAKACLEGMLETHPNDRQVLREIGMLINGIDVDGEETLVAYQRALDAHPEWSLLHSDLSRYLSASVPLAAAAEARGMPDAAAYALEASRTIEGQPELRAILGIEAGQTVADIGCGCGRYTFLLADWAGAEGTVWAVDISTEYLAVTEEAAGRKGLDTVRAHVGTTASLGLAPGSVDVAFMSRVWVSASTSPHADAWLGTIAAALAPEGRLVVTGEPRMSLLDLQARLAPHGLVLTTKGHFAEEGETWTFAASVD